MVNDIKPLKTYDVPEGTRLDECQSCGAPIQWVLTGNVNKKTGKPSRVPVNPDSKTSHFTNCPQAKQWSGGRRNPC